MTTPAIITVAITGAIPRKADTPAVPVTPSEQIERKNALPQAGYGVARDRLGKLPQADLRESSAARGGPRKHDARLPYKARDRGVRRRDALQREGARRPRLAQAAMPRAIR